jgi:hypothetical protein
MIENSFNLGQEQTRKPLPEAYRQGAIAGAGADSWEYRSKSMKCMTCIWYVTKQRIGTSNSDINPLAEVGRCRRHAPTMNGYPVVYMTDWCGDHRIDENKV